jgi:TetR/AcrR family transcriptional regulator
MATRKTPQPTPHAAPVQRARGPGRPVGGGSGEQRDRLLDMALALFARQGFADTTMAAIAREAGVTPAMMSYYFSTRDHLIDMLIDERFLPVRAAIGGAFDANADDPVAAIAHLARRLVEVATQYPWFAPLWVRSVIGGEGVLKRRMRERHGQSDLRALECIARWQEQGRLNAALSPSLLMLSLLGLTILPLASAVSEHGGLAGHQVDAAAIARHAVAVLVQGVGPQPPALRADT